MDLARKTRRCACKECTCRARVLHPILPAPGAPPLLATCRIFAAGYFWGDSWCFMALRRHCLCRRVDFPGWHALPPRWRLGAGGAVRRLCVGSPRSVLVDHAPRPAGEPSEAGELHRAAPAACPPARLSPQQGARRDAEAELRPAGGRGAGGREPERLVQRGVQLRAPAAAGTLPVPRALRGRVRPRRRGALPGAPAAPAAAGLGAGACRQ